MAIPPDLGILYPNGQVEAVQMYIWNGSKPIPWDGSVTFSGSLPSTVAGNLTNNNAVPAATQLGVLIGLAGATALSYTTGNQVLPSTDLEGQLRTRSGNQAPAARCFTGVHVPSTNTQATKTQASAGSGKRNVCTGFTFTLCANGSAPTPSTPITIAIIDGASGGSTKLWQSNINMPAVAGGIVSFNRSGLWLVGSQATALTIEFSAAGGTNTYESVAIDGVIIEE